MNAQPDSRPPAGPLITYSNDYGVIEMRLPLPDEGGRSMEEWEGLFMAAPSLLMALETLIIATKGRGDGHSGFTIEEMCESEYAAARAAIAKARGAA